MHLVVPCSMYFWTLLMTSRPQWHTAWLLSGSWRDLPWVWPCRAVCIPLTFGAVGRMQLLHALRAKMENLSYHFCSTDRRRICSIPPRILVRPNTDKIQAVRENLFLNVTKQLHPGRNPIKVNSDFPKAWRQLFFVSCCLDRPCFAEGI